MVSVLGMLPAIYHYLYQIEVSAGLLAAAQV